MKCNRSILSYLTYVRTRILGLCTSSSQYFRNCSTVCRGTVMSVPCCCSCRAVFNFSCTSFLVLPYNVFRFMCEGVFGRPIMLPLHSSPECMLQESAGLSHRIAFLLCWPSSWPSQAAPLVSTPLPLLLSHFDTNPSSTSSFRTSLLVYHLLALSPNI